MQYYNDYQTLTQALHQQKLEFSYQQGPSYWIFEHPRNVLYAEVTRTPGGAYRVRYNHRNSSFKKGVITDADRRREPPPRTTTRGRKPEPVFDKLLKKIEIRGAPDPDIKWTIPEFALIDPTHWPGELHQPWLWTGSVMKGGSRSRVVRHWETEYFVRSDEQSRPQFKWGESTFSPVRLFWELMIGEIPDGCRLKMKATQGQASWTKNVNPVHYETNRLQSNFDWNFTRLDFEPDIDTPEARIEEQANYSMSSEDIADFADLVEERMAQQRIPTYDDFLEEFQMDLFDATEDDVRAILKTAGLLERYGFSLNS